MRRRRWSPGWVEMSVALAALMVSAVSLYIAHRQTDVMNRQLAASIWPAMQYSSSNVRNGESVIAMTVENGGIGPARIERFRLSHEGREIPNLTEFIADCCAPEGTPVRTVTSFVEGRIIPAGDRIDFLTLPLDEQAPEIFHRFDRIRGEIDLEICYCSVLEDCWTMSRADRDPRPVRTCAE